jgi:hypothetical protein
MSTYHLYKLKDLNLLNAYFIYYLVRADNPKVTYRGDELNKLKRYSIEKGNVCGIKYCNLVATLTDVSDPTNLAKTHPELFL